MVIQQNRYILAAQQLIRLWSGARGVDSGPVETVRSELEGLARQVGLDLAMARRLTAETLELLVAPNEAMDPLRGWLLAEMLYLDGRLSEQEGDVTGAAASDARALRLYERLDPDRLPELELESPTARIRELRARLGT